jgi:hypothetical protein
MATKPTSEIAFVICQIGEADTPERKRADDVIKYIIEPAISKWSLKPLRSDQDPTPGQVTSRIITSLIHARVVIADLTGRNPNVYYELAVAHSFGRPVIILVDHAKSLTFDTQHERVIQIRDSGTIGASQADEASKELIRQLEVVMAHGYKPSNLVTDVATARRLADLAANDPIAAQLATIGEDVQEIKSRLAANRFYDAAATVIEPTVYSRNIVEPGAAYRLYPVQPPIHAAVPAPITRAQVNSKRKRPR